MEEKVAGVKVERVKVERVKVEGGRVVRGRNLERVKAEGGKVEMASLRKYYCLPCCCILFCMHMYLVAHSFL